MNDADDPDATRNRRELLRRAAMLGEDVMRIADDLRMPIAALHICQGVEMIREEAERLSSRPH